MSTFAFGFGFAAGVVSGVGGGKLPTPLNVTLAGVANIGGGEGTPWQPVPVHNGAVTGCAPSTLASYRSNASL